MFSHIQHGDRIDIYITYSMTR